MLKAKCLLLNINIQIKSKILFHNLYTNFIASINIRNAEKDNEICKLYLKIMIYKSVVLLNFDRVNFYSEQN